MPVAARLALVPLAVGAVVLGVLALPPLAGRVHDLLGGAGPEPGLLELLVSAALAIATLAVRWR